MKYRIGEVAEFFGMTKEGVRYLERQGVIRSSRDESNGYRYFPRAEITKLKLIRSYQAIGFTLDEAQEIILHPQKDDLIERMDEKIRALEEKEEQIRWMKRMLMEEKAAVETFFNRIDRFEIVERPAYMLFPRVGDEASGMSADGRERIVQARQMEKVWIQKMPPVRLGALHCDAQGNRIENMYGSAVLEKHAQALGLPIPESVVRLPQQRCLRGYLESVPGERLDPKRMFDWIETNGLCACGDAFGIICCSTINKEGMAIRLHEVYIPVCEKTVNKA